MFCMILSNYNFADDLYGRSICFKSGLFLFLSLIDNINGPNDKYTFL